MGKLCCAGPLIDSAFYHNFALCESSATVSIAHLCAFPSRSSRPALGTHVLPRRHDVENRSSFAGKLSGRSSDGVGSWLFSRPLVVMFQARTDDSSDAAFQAWVSCCR